jgi:hypothetical protein
LVYPSGAEPLDHYTTQSEAETVASELALANRGTTYLIERAEVDTASTVGTADTTTITPAELMHVAFDGNSDDPISSWNSTWLDGSPTYTTDAVWEQAALMSTTNRRAAFTGREPDVVGDHGDFGVFVWYKGTTGGQCVISRWDSSSTYMWSFAISPGTSVWQGIVYDTTGGTKQRTVAFTDLDVWVFTGISWNNATETGSGYLGINGATLNGFALTDSGWTGPKRSSGVPDLTLGGSVSWDVKLDDFRYYGRFLSTAEVTALYDEGKAALGI